MATPEPVVRESTRVSPVATPRSGKRRRPSPTTTGKTSSRYSSTRSCSCSVRTSPPLPCTCNSRPGCRLRSATAAGTSPVSTVVGPHSGAVSVVEATYFGSVLSRLATGSSAGVLVRTARSLHHSVDREERGHRQLHRALLPDGPTNGQTPRTPETYRSPSPHVRRGAVGVVVGPGYRRRSRGE